MFNYQPLASQLRPDALQDFVGQTHLLAPGKVLRRALEGQYIHSFIISGPPGTGKTSFANLVAKAWQLPMESWSALSTGVKDIRSLLEKMQQLNQKTCLLFIDEIHRYNKAQQDALLPLIENGKLVVIGATTENPAHAINHALLSRMKLYLFKALTENDLTKLLDKAIAKLSYEDKGSWIFPEELKLQFIRMMDGDARKLLNHIEMLHAQHQDEETIKIDLETLEALFLGQYRHFDKNGDKHYQQISALHKSIRGSDADASLYWLCRMLDGGCDPLYIARRLIRIASEDIGLADLKALDISMRAYDVYAKLGSPEGELALAQATLYLAMTSKSDAVYKAYQRTMTFISESGSLEVPLHLQNHNQIAAQSLGIEAYYRNPQEERGGILAGAQYFPDSLEGGLNLYQPSDRGLEAKISERLKRLRQIIYTESND